MKSRGLRLVSLFAGAGGLDLGLEAAGFDSRVAVEMDADAVATLRANRDWTVIREDVHSVSTARLLREAGLRRKTVDLLAAGPPCQPFSKSGYWVTGDSGRLLDPRARTIEAFLDVLDRALPRAFVLENVPGLAFAGKTEGLSLIERRLDEINQASGSRYSASVLRLRATDYGLPQDRSRLFVIGFRDGSSVVAPEPTHYAAHQCPPEASGLREGLTAWDAIGDLQDDYDPVLEVTGRWAGLLPTIPEGANYLHHTAAGKGKEIFGWRRRYWSFLLKLAKNRPSWTLTASPGSATGPFHWKNRRLSVEEMLRLQTFPAGYALVGEYRSCTRQLGNAVPCALAEVVGRSIVGCLQPDFASRDRLTLLPAKSRPIPPPERRRPVPRQYNALVGPKEAHPGEGRGPGAVNFPASPA